MKRAFIFLNGELSSIPKFKKFKQDILIGVDGGTKHILTLGLKPDLIIGDFDSLSQFPQGIPIIKYPKDKDFTDAELALNYCRKIKIEEIIIFGFFGRRLDHMISSFMVMTKSNLTIKILEGNQELQIIKDKIILTGEKGDLVSLIPLLKNCRRVTTNGLKWRLQGETLKVGSSRGVSNVMTGKIASVRLKKGCLLVVKTSLQGENLQVFW